MSGRTAWFPKDAAWHRRGRVVELGQEHGPAGPLVLDWLMCEARTQNAARTGDGTVKAGYAAIAHACFLPGRDDARRIIATCVELGLLDDFEDESDERTFTARISGWHEDVNLAIDAARKAAGRKKPDETGPLGPGQGDEEPATEVPEKARVSSNVPERPKAPKESPTRQDKTEQQTARDARSDDAWPDRLSEPLRFTAAAVHLRLKALVEAKGKGTVPSRRRVGEIIADYPEHDHQTLVGDVFDFWVHGKGKGIDRKDWGKVYRDWVKRNLPGGQGGSVHRHPSAGGPGGGAVRAKLLGGGA